MVAPNEKARKISQKEQLPFILHWIVLTVIAFTILHIQVVTRFMSATPPLYWFLARRLLDKSNWMAFKLFHSIPLEKLAILVYCLAYLLVGCLLHTNFFPWT